jgi:hypothetical protein
MGACGFIGPILTRTVAPISGGVERACNWSTLMKESITDDTYYNSIFSIFGTVWK